VPAKAQVTGTSTARPSQSPARYRGHRNDGLQHVDTEVHRRKVQPDTEGIETRPTSRSRSYLLFFIISRKVQPDTEGIETAIAAGLVSVLNPEVAKSSPIPRA
jgi:hypothetical protein